MKFVTQYRTWARRRYNLSRDWVLDVIGQPYHTETVKECLPEQLRRRTLYVVEEDGFEEQAAMMCPCGRDHILHLNLLPDERPLWRVTRHEDQTVSLHPSVWRKKDCWVHFWFRNGQIKWVKDRARSKK